jgi:hypothetical protein
MDANRFDTFSRLFAGRRLSRRSALARGSAGLSAAALAAAGLTSVARANADTPAADETAEKTGFLFVQSFQAGSIAPTDGTDGRYTLTLEAGTGQTIYFSDRPERIVGTNSTSDFLEGLGFPDDNPPNAALVIESASGETDIAVVELFAPVYDSVSNGVTYEIEVLADWEDALAMGLAGAPSDLATLAPEFGTANLFIDDCANRGIVCTSGDQSVGEFLSQGFCYWWRYAGCYPCENGGAADRDAIAAYWKEKCNATYPACNGDCGVAYAGPVICTDPNGCN